MSADRQWLVKSSDSILGPLEFDKVVENIFNGDIHLLDEIKGPFERWRPIKDHSLFAAAIEKLKASTYQRRENTMTATIDLGTQTDLTGIQTISVTDVEEVSDLTPDSLPSTTVEHSPQSYEVPSTQGNANPIELPDFPDQRQVRSGALKGATQTKRRFPVVFVMTFLLLIVAGASYLVYEFKQTRLIEQKISAYAQLTDSAIEYLKLGEYQKALKNFNLAYSISPKDPNLLIEMSPLSIQFAGQFDHVQTNLENLLVLNKQKAMKKMARTIIGLSYSYRKMFGEALASYNAALIFDDQFMPAMLNKSFVLLKLKKFDDGISVMRQAVREYPDKPIAHFFYIRALLEKGLQKEDAASLKELLSVADQFPQKFSDFKQEVLFMVALAHLKLGASQEVIEDAVRAFLKIDIELTNLHVHNTLIDFQAFNWIDFSKYCKGLEKDLSDYLGSMLQGFCYLKIGQTFDAKKIFERLLSQNNEDGVLQALYASSLLKMNDLSQAKNALGLLNQIDQKQPVVETILRGCLVEGDLRCGQAIFNGRHTKHISPLYYHWGKGAVEYSRSRKQAKESTDKGLVLSSQFAPLLKMKGKF